MLYKIVYLKIIKYTQNTLKITGSLVIVPIFLDLFVLHVSRF